MTVDAAMADIERTGDVHDGRLGEPVPPQNVLGYLQDPLRGQNHDFVQARTCETMGRRVVI
jgi:hypothetical protein